MLLKIYEMLWAIIAVIAILLLVTGNFTMLTAVAFGFIGFGMIFMGMISVLPATVVHHGPPEPIGVKPLKAEKVKEERVFAPNHLAVR